MLVEKKASQLLILLTYGLKNLNVMGYELVLPKQSLWNANLEGVKNRDVTYSLTT